MDYGEFVGSHLSYNGPWAPNVVLSGPIPGSASTENLMVDQYALAAGTDPYDQSAVVVIPAGRFVSIGNARSINGGSNGYRPGSTYSGRTPLTLHDGLNLTPIGFSENQMYKSFSTPNIFLTESNTVHYRKGVDVECPYVSTVNDAHGTLVSGDKVTGYWGSTTSTTNIAAHHRGKAVKWNARRTHSVSTAASTLVQLSAAVYPGVTPRVITGLSPNGTAVASSATAWNATFAKWVATFSTPVISVLYDHGQDADQIAGSCLRIQSISEILSTHPFNKWVEMAQSDMLNWPMAPAATRFPVTSVGSGANPVDGSNWETPSTVTADAKYRVAHYPMSIQHPVFVAIQGTITDKDGVTFTYTGSESDDWYILPTSAIQDMRGYFIGLYHTVNWRTGIIELSANISSVTGIKVLYSYMSNPYDGPALWGGGIHGISDGSNVSNDGSPAYGLPAQLNVVGGGGALRLAVA